MNYTGETGNKYTPIGPVSYQGKKGCQDPHCRHFFENGEMSEGCAGWHCSYCDAHCSMMGHRCDAAEAFLGEARRIAGEASAWVEE